MTPEQDKASRITAFPPPYVKEQVLEYVNQHEDMTVSTFVTDAIKEHIKRVKGSNMTKPASRFIY